MKKEKHKHNHSMSVKSMDEIATSSPLACMNAGLKTLFTIAMLAVAISFDNLYFSVFLTVAMIVLLRFCAGLHFSMILKLMCVPIAFILISCLAIAVQISAEAVNAICGFKLFGVYFFLTQATLYQAMKLFFRAYSAVQCLYFLATTTSVSEVIGVLQKCKFPKIFTELMYLIYRYLFVLLETMTKLQTSAKSRLGYSSYSASWRSFGGVASGVLVNSFKRSSKCFDALESRCYEGDINFYTEEVKVKAKHVFLMAAFVLFTLAVGLALTFLGVQYG